MGEKRKILLIGGTGEAVQINNVLYEDENVELVTSLAGRTNAPTPLKGQVISGGFSDRGGLEKYLQTERFDQIIDATHPFAIQISQSAQKACACLNIPYLRFEREVWKKQNGDNWVEVADMEEAALEATAFSRIFLTVGRQEIGTFSSLTEKYFLIRSIEETDFFPVRSEVCHIRERGPFAVSHELSLMQDKRIDVVVTKNSGGASTYAKIEAARELSLPVIIVKRPPYINGNIVHDIDGLVEAIRLSS